MRIALALFLFALPVAAHADTGITKCDLSGYVNDPDPKGTNLRSGPSVTAPVIGHLPPQHDDPDAQTNIGAEFTIIGSKDGWLEIENATDGPFNKDPTFRFKGPAWISGALVDFTIGSNKMYSAPSYKSSVVTALSGDGPDGAWGPDSFGVKRVYGCSGHFADISGVTPTKIKKTYRGWIGQTCSNQVTTCDPGEEAHLP
ncbi:MAG TPA: SH3 domain-containing protein [Rhizomicrobium sp.]|nr:SH3 domain-containing protein [Rhizomicrobium sp.]